MPVIADANSMTYVLHKALGDDIVITRGGRPVRLRLVAALADSIFQSELLMSDANFLSCFPEQEGYRLLLVDGAARTARRSRRAAIEDGAAISAPMRRSTAERLAEFHRVENTYLSTFQTLGGLGLLVGTVGLAAVLLRNVLERRRELALLGAVGYGATHVFADRRSRRTSLLLGWGLADRHGCARSSRSRRRVAERGGRLPLGGWRRAAAGRGLRDRAAIVDGRDAGRAAGAAARSAASGIAA